jgi:hypothetical protein
VAEVDTRIEVTGLAEALKTLQKIDPELRKEVIKGMKTAAAPLEAAARSLIPDARPLTNWYGWQQTRTGGKGPGPWDPSAARKGIKVAFRGGKVRGVAGDVFPLLTLRQTNAAGAIFDIAGRAGGTGKRSEGKERGQAMADKLNRSGPTSRSMWPAVERNMPAIMGSLEGVVDTVSQRITKELR